MPGRCPADSLRALQERAKRAPGRPLHGPRGPESPRRIVPRRSRWSPDGPRHPRWFPYGPRRVQDLKRPPRGLPIEPQEGPESLNSSIIR
eukprot:8549853-Pyramimonas_sp.AAC.1